MNDIMFAFAFLAWQLICVSIISKCLKPKAMLRNSWWDIAHLQSGWSLEKLKLVYQITFYIVYDFWLFKDDLFMHCFSYPEAGFYCEYFACICLTVIFMRWKELWAGMICAAMAEEEMHTK